MQGKINLGGVQKVCHALKVSGFVRSKHILVYRVGGLVKVKMYVPWRAQLTALDDRWEVNDSPQDD